MAPTTTRRPRAPQGQGGRLRHELIAAADRILAETGDEQGLSLRAVAREAGVAAPSIYLHFADKQELVTAVMQARFAELASAITAADAGSGPEAGHRLRGRSMAYVRFAIEQPGAYRILFGNRSALMPEAPPEELTGADAIGALGAAVAARLGPGGDALRATVHLWTALHGIVSLRASAPGFPWPPLDRQVDDVLAGLPGA